ncbi:hypothetical protein L6452_02150 [Arctium lappa]|uniref:Uncharacterized protein n=1 Tax=Arctium lappa TaxID=4217 RepID=A0ACB9FJI7_ARCLA|nr:hypothetical protein L6452_02150 [Arctium lappa]
MLWLRPVYHALGPLYAVVPLSCHCLHRGVSAAAPFTPCDYAATCTAKNHGHAAGAGLRSSASYWPRAMWLGSVHRPPTVGHLAMRLVQLEASTRCCCRQIASTERWPQRRVVRRLLNHG